LPKPEISEKIGYWQLHNDPLPSMAGLSSKFSFKLWLAHCCNIVCGSLGGLTTVCCDVLKSEFLIVLWC